MPSANPTSSQTQGILLPRSFFSQPSFSDDSRFVDGARAPKIIYATRTHSQLSQVIRELKSTAYKYTLPPFVELHEFLMVLQTSFDRPW